jgi:hypothetical protein
MGSIISMVVFVGGKAKCSSPHKSIHFCHMVSRARFRHHKNDYMINAKLARSVLSVVPVGCLEYRSRWLWIFVLVTLVGRYGLSAGRRVAVQLSAGRGVSVSSRLLHGCLRELDGGGWLLDRGGCRFGSVFGGSDRDS